MKWLVVLVAIAVGTYADDWDADIDVSGSYDGGLGVGGLGLGVGGLGLGVGGLGLGVDVDVGLGVGVDVGLGVGGFVEDVAVGDGEYVYDYYDDDYYGGLYDGGVSFSGDLSVSGSFSESISISGDIGIGDWCPCIFDELTLDGILAQGDYREYVSVIDFEHYARRITDIRRRDFFTDGSDNQTTTRDNDDAYSRYKIRPRVMTGVGIPDTSVGVIGGAASFPLGISPIPFLSWAHPDGEIGAALAAGCEGVPMIVSTFSNTFLEEIRFVAQLTNLWMEVYIFRDRRITHNIVKRAQYFGYQAIVVTVDSPVAGNILQDKRNPFLLPNFLGVPNIADDNIIFNRTGKFPRFSILGDVDVDVDGVGVGIGVGVGLDSSGYSGSSGYADGFVEAGFVEADYVGDVYVDDEYVVDEYVAYGDDVGIYDDGDYLDDTDYYKKRKRRDIGIGYEYDDGFGYDGIDVDAYAAVDEYGDVYAGAYVDDYADGDIVIADIGYEDDVLYGDYGDSLVNDAYEYNDGLGYGFNGRLGLGGDGTYAGDVILKEDHSHDHHGLGEEAFDGPRRLGDERILFDIGIQTYEAFFDSVVDPGQTWDDFKYVRDITDLPVVAKGILTGCDAREAARHGANAVIVSNHHGKGLDETPATIEALAEVVESLRDNDFDHIQIYLDGGIRFGTDIFKAITIGADAVFVNRPIAWGQLHSGRCGVKRVLRILHEEFTRTMTLVGVGSVDNIVRTMTVPESYFRHRYEADYRRHGDRRGESSGDSHLVCPFDYDIDHLAPKGLEVSVDIGDPGVDVSFVVDISSSSSSSSSGPSSSSSSSSDSLVDVTDSFSFSSESDSISSSSSSSSSSDLLDIGISASVGIGK